MKENARQGFWNGSQPPFGYRTFEAERRGEKVKRKLEIDPHEAEIVRMLFELHLRGAAGTPMGIRRLPIISTGRDCAIAVSGCSAQALSIGC
jgi:site-specific DNA recombinase